MPQPSLASHQKAAKKVQSLQSQKVNAAAGAQYSVVTSPIGPLTIVTDATHLKAIGFGKIAVTDMAEATKSNDVHHQTCQQLEEYFAGERQEFTLPLAPDGTAFQQQVWQALRGIPFGATVSYGHIAHKIGNSKASRAVGAANGRNPIPIVIPCHRVIGTNGKLTGFAGGLAIKTQLLAIEGHQDMKA